MVFAQKDSKIFETLSKETKSSLFRETLDFAQNVERRSYLEIGLKTGWRFPEGNIKIHTYVFEAEEIIMISLFRLAHPHSWLPVAHYFPGRSIGELSRAFRWFLDFCIVNWGYLLLNNMEFWVDFLPESAEAMRGFHI